MPIYSLPELRSSAPPELQGASDAELLKAYADHTGIPLLQVAQQLGVPTGKDRGAFAAGLSSGVDDLQGVGYSALAAGADATGLRGARDYLNRRADMNQVESQLNGRPDLEQIESVYDKPSQYLPYASYQVAKQVPNIVGAVAAGLLAPEVAVPAAMVRGAAILPRVVGGGGMAARVAEAALTGGSEFGARRAALEAGQTFGRQVVGGGAFNYGQSVGSLYQAAADGGNPDAGAASLAGGVPYALTETLPEAMLVGRIGHGAGFTGSMPTRMAKAGLTQGAAGASSELMQNEMEMAYNGHVSPEQALSQRLNSGVAGGLVESIMGLPGGIRGTRRMPLKSVDQGSTDLLTGRDPLELSTYGQADGPAYGQPQPDAQQRMALAMPGQHPLFNPDGSPTYGADPSFSDTNPLRPMEADYTTAPGAAPMRQPGMDYQTIVDTRGLALAPRMDDGRTIDLFSGEPTHAPAAPADQLELTHPDASVARQLEMHLEQAPPAPTEPALPQGGQRGTTGQLQFSANTKSPKGQVMQGMADSLAADGHLDDGSHQQASTLIAQGKFAAAKKLIDDAAKNRDAADDAVQQAKEQHLDVLATSDRKAQADELFTQIDAKAKERAKLLSRNGNRPAIGSAKREQWNKLTDEIHADKERWAELSKPPKEAASADQPRVAEQRPSDAPAGGRVQRDGGQRDAAGVQPVAADATGAAPRSGEAAPTVPVDDQPVSALAGVSTEALAETADDAKDNAQYEQVLDELYDRWMIGNDDAAEKFFDDNAHVPGFNKDVERAEQRARAKTNEGKRGLKLGRHPQGDLAPEAKETDALLRGVTTPKFRTREGEALPAPAQVVSDSDLKSALAAVQRAVPGVSIEVHDNPEAAGIPGVPGGKDTPMGVTMRDGRIMLFRDGLADRMEAMRTAFHELFHKGLANLLPEAEYHRMMDALYQADTEVQQRAHAWGHSEEAKTRQKDGMSNRALRSLAIEEALAEMAEDLKTQKPSTIRAISDWLAKVAERLGMKELAQWLRRAKLTDAQQFIEHALGAVAEPAPAADGPTTKFKLKNAAGDDAVAKSFAEIPYAKTILGQKVQDALFNLRESPWALKWITNDQIAEGYKHLKPVLDINRATSRMASVANRYLENASQTAKRWRALDDATQLSMQKVMLQSTMDEMHVSIKADGKYIGVDQAWKHPLNKHLEQKPAVRQAFNTLYREFQALPAPAKAVYDQVRDDLAKQHDDTLKALRKSAADHYASQLKRALTDEELSALANSDAGAKAAFKGSLDLAGTATEIRALEGLYRALRDLNSDFGTVKGPYFPLVRFGDHVVVMKSEDMVELEMAAQSLRLELQTAMEKAPAAADAAAEAHDAQVAELRDRYNRALKAVQAAKQDEKKYAVEFHETPAQAERARLALAEKHPTADVYRSVREQYYRALDGASPAFLNDLTQTLSAALDSGDGVSAEAKTAALQATKDMYLRRQPERSALRSELKRMSIEGVQSAQMLRGYAQSARNGAWRISRLLHAGEVTQGLAHLSEDRRSADAKHVLNELKARFVGDIAAPENNTWLQRLQGATYFMHLGFNISYFVTNATQAWAISLPVMGGRHGIVNSANSLMAASKDVIRLLSTATAKSIEENGAVVGLQLRLTDEQIASLAKDAGESAMLKALTDDGVIDITIKHDLGAISDGTSKSIPGRVMEVSSALANFPELYNRLSTALAAYRMESARREGGTETAEQVQQRAQSYAENVINRTHFNYSPENAPRMMRGQLGRLVFQFKRYQQGMIYLFAKLIRDSSNGDADARRSLAYLLGATTAVGGVAALPIAAPFALAAKVLAAAYPDDDEPDWLQQWYNGMKDGIGETAAQALAKGLPTIAGLDLSKKLGQGDLLNPVAFANTSGKKVFSRDYMTEVGFSLLGPGAAMLGNEAEAVGAAKSGDFLKAAEKGMPTFVANVLKAFHRADEGLTTKQGDTIMEADEFGALSVAAKAAGFESVKVSDTYDNRASYMQAIANRREARQGLLRQYYEAVKTGDQAKMESARQAITDFNERQPADRVRGQDLGASIKQHAQRTAETRGGLRVGKRDTDTYNRLTGQ